MFLPLVILLSVLSGAQESSVAAAAGAQPNRPAPAQPALTGDTEPNQGRAVRICRNERTIGSNLTRRVCRNRFQSSAAEQANREMIRQMQGARVAGAN